MHACRITTSDAPGSPDLHVLLLREQTQGLDRPLESYARKILSEEIDSPRCVWVDGLGHLLIRIDDKSWLTGGENWRMAGCQIAQELRNHGLNTARVQGDAEATEWQALVEGMLLGDYRYTTCRTGKAAQRHTITIQLPKEADQAISRGVCIASAQNTAREFGDGPGNLVNPQTVVIRARELFHGTNIELEVIQGCTDLETARFPGLVHVGRGAAVEPALLQLRYRPKEVGIAESPKLALVGKGITFDSGGISLKPGAGMWMMKGDMGGAVAVLGAMLALAELQPPIAIDAYCPLAENMPDARAGRPGDIYQARNGQYIHVDNTDAEGRLVLSDVLTYAGEQGATHMVDLATLTGACVIALGNGGAGLMSNNDEWAERVGSAGDAVGERLWRLPLPGDYRKQLEHPHADINNVGGKPAGTITAGLFLKEFVDPAIAWAHLDIAGPAIQENAWRYYQPGMIGFGVRSLVELAMEMS